MAGQDGQAGFRANPSSLSCLRQYDASSSGKRGLFFQHAFGCFVMALGHSYAYPSGVPPSRGILKYIEGTDNVGLGIYYSPKLAYRINEWSSVCVGSNFQALLNGSAGLVLTAPLTVGGSVGTHATDDDLENYDIGGFLNAGLGAGMWAGVEPDYPDVEPLIGPYMDCGLRLYQAEIKFTASRSFKNIGDEPFLFSLGLGYSF